MQIDCIFTAIAAGIELAGDPDLVALDVVMIGTDTAMACGAKAKYKRKPKGKTSPCKKKCFAAGTLIHTREGLKPIEEIKVGDEVKSMNPQTGEVAYKRVTNAHTNHFDSVGLVSLKDETDGSETLLSVTATHPFYHVENGWVHASLLEVGDKLAGLNGGTLTVTEVTFNLDAPINLTYNLEVADFHTYFVGEDGVLVHNGRGAAWRSILNDPNTPKWAKGWIKHHLGRGRPLSKMLTPPGCNLGHLPSNRKSHNSTSRLELISDNQRRPKITNNNPKWR